MVYNRRVTGYWLLVIGYRLLVIVESSGCVDSSICRVGRVCENGWLGGAGHFAMAALGGLLQKGGVPAAPSGTATLLRLSPSHQFYLRALLAVTHFRYSRLPWLDGRCVQGPGTYSPRHG